MKKGLFIRVMICILAVACLQYKYLQHQSSLLKLRLEIPKISALVRQMDEENARLQYEIHRFEEPSRLMQIAKNPQYSHLQHPRLSQIVTLNEKKGSGKRSSATHIARKVATPKKHKIVLGAKSQ